MNTKIEHTKKTLMESIVKLTKTQSLDAITVSELCRVAQINRTTFYKYYSIPVDIITEAVHTVTNRFFGRIDGRFLPLEESMRFLCEQCQRNQWLLNQYELMHGRLDQIVEEAFATTQLHSVERNAVHYFVAGGVSTLLVNWLREGCLQPSERMAHFLAELTHIVMEKGIPALTSLIMEQT